MAARFGHGMVLAPSPLGAAGNVLLISGGYTAAGFSGDFFACAVDGSSCTDLTYGCPDAPDLPTPASVGLTPRYGMNMATDGEFIWVWGGVSSDMRGIEEMFKFYLQGCSWQQLKMDGAVTASALQGASVMAGSSLVVHGGDSAAANFAETFVVGL